MARIHAPSLPAPSNRLALGRGMSTLPCFAAFLLIGAGCNGSMTIPQEVAEQEEEYQDNIEELDEEESLAEMDEEYKSDGVSYSLTTTHDISLYAQGASAWRKKLMFHGSHCSKTIGKIGCAVTSLAMAASYYGGDNTPYQQSECHYRNSGHSGCDLVWETDACLPDGMTYEGTNDNSLATIRGELDDGYPVIAHVRKAGRSSCHHFVLITGYDGTGRNFSQFEIFDPATGTERRLNKYAHVCSTRIYHGLPGT